MKSSAAVLAVACLLLAACQTTKSVRQVDPAVPVSGTTAPAQTTDDVAARVRHAAELLAAARTAALVGDLEEFRDCEAVLVQALVDNRELIAASPELSSLASDTARELDRLASTLDALQENGDDEEGGDEVATEAVPEDLEAVAEDHVAELARASASENFDLPVVVNTDVTALIDFYTGRYRERFAASLQRGGSYLPFIREELRKAALPEDLAYLPLIESGFSIKARSRARAQGLWQFMKGTARLYDLRVDSVIDERNDPYLATSAAVRHLKDLFAMFGNWELVLAAYNSGAGRVQRAIARSHNGTDYWSIRRHLPRETRNYVPAMWAALVVAKSPETFGMERPVESSICIDRVTVEGALDIEVLAERTGIAIEELETLNPALVRRITPADGSYQLAVPCGLGSCATETLASIPRSERIRRIVHVVKKGDTPSGIARKYGSSVDALVAANSPRILRILRIGDTIVVPKLSTPAKETSRTRSSRTRSHTTGAAQSAGGSDRYVVRRGDTLYDIARRFGTTTAELQKRNNLQGSRIHPGDVLYVTD